MILPNQTILYVEDLARSRDFYSALLGRKPALESPNYALFELEGGHKLGLLLRSKVDLPAAPPGESGELCFTAPDADSLQSLHDRWKAGGMRMALGPVKMYFGSVNFVGLDPDGHRLRVSTPDRA